MPRVREQVTKIIDQTLIDVAKVQKDQEQFNPMAPPQNIPKGTIPNNEALKSLGQETLGKFRDQLKLSGLNEIQKVIKDLPEPIQKDIRVFASGKIFPEFAKGKQNTFTNDDQFWKAVETKIAISKEVKDFDSKFMQKSLDKE